MHHSELEKLKKMKKYFGKEMEEEAPAKKTKKLKIEKKEEDEWEDVNEEERNVGMRMEREAMNEQDLVEDGEERADNLHYEEDFDDEFDEERLEPEESEHSSDYVTASEGEEEDKNPNAVGSFYSRWLRRRWGQRRARS